MVYYAIQLGYYFKKCQKLEIFFKGKKYKILG